MQACSMALLILTLIGQEISSPFLSLFFLLRAYKSLASLATKACFLIFAALFFLGRVFINSWVTCLFLLEVYRNYRGGATTLAAVPPLSQAVLSVAVCGGAGLQLYWAKGIALKVYNGIRGKPQAAQECVSIE